MKKIYVIGIILIAFAIATAFYIYQQKKATPPIVSGNNPDLILYYGDTCPHCQVVEDFLAQNGIVAKVNFEQKEVFDNRDNNKELAQKAELCKINLENAGVPFLWNNGTCLMGEDEIINFFKDKTGIK